MDYEGVVRKDSLTKNLVKRLKPGEIALIDHADLDRVTAESLIETRVGAVVNASSFITGRYPNMGPYLLASQGIFLIDRVGPLILTQVKEGERIRLQKGKIFKKNELIAQGKTLDLEILSKKMEEAKKGLSLELEKFAVNTLSYLSQEKELLLNGVNLPNVSVKMRDRQALVVARGYDYKEDLKTLRSYIREMKPVLIGVDGGADALLSEGLKPEVIIGDMDSVSNEALACGAELIVHAYPDGRAPGLKRLERLGFEPSLFKITGTSEDIALLLAYEKGADLIVAVGTHANLIEFLDKGRGGMASTFLTRLKVGGKLVDAKGVSKLYRSIPKISYLFIITAAALTAIITVVLVSPSVKQLFSLLYTKLRLIFGP